MMLAKMAAQELVDGLSAVTLGASLLFVFGNGRSPVRARLAFAFGGLSVFFALRAAANALDAHGLEVIELLTVCFLPLAALLLAEGVLRRHAPRLLKILVTLGAVALAVALAATGARLSPWFLGTYVVVALLGATMLLLLRERTSLSVQENASVDALMISGAVLTLLSATDFLPMAAVGFSGVGAAIVAFVLGANSRSGRESANAYLDVAAMALVAAIAAIVISHALGLAAAPEQIRMFALLLSLLLVVSSVLRLRHLRVGGDTQGLARALADADIGNLDSFLTDLAREPLLAGLRLAQGAMFTEYDADGLGAAMAARAVWTRASLAAAPARARDELGDLMTRQEATHAVMVSRSPLKIILLTLPAVGFADDSETSLALFHKLATVAAERRT
jgi:hypothetical protein